MPDDNPFRKVLDERVEATVGGNPFARERQRRSDGPSANFVFRERMARTALNSLMAVPDAGGELLADALNVGRAVAGKAARAGVNNARALVGMERTPNPSLGERYDAATATEGVPQRTLRAIGRPSIEGTMARVESLPALVPGGESFDQAVDRNLGEDTAEQAAQREAHPMAAMAGDIGGDVLSLFIGRRSSGSGRVVQRLETRLAGRAAVEASETLATDLGKVLKGPGMQRLARGGLRSVEAGVEAAALDILKDENADPMETAALAAGGQLVGSGALSAAKGLVTGGPASAGLKLSLAAISTAGLLQVLKSSAPGGRDRVLESVESGYEKVALALGLGMASAAIGATRYGRGNTHLAEQSRAFLDGVSTVHRGTVLSVLTSWTDGDEKQQATIERVLTALGEDPEFKGKNDEERALVRQLRDSTQLKADAYETGGAF